MQDNVLVVMVYGQLPRPSGGYLSSMLSNDVNEIQQQHGTARTVKLPMTM